jgi:hypothetical protein
VLAVASTRNAPFHLHMVGSLLSSGIQLKCHYLRTSLTILSHSASYSAHLPSTWTFYPINRNGLFTCVSH